MNKILIFAPSLEDEIIASFPLIHLIEEKLEPEEINIIEFGDSGKLYKALPYEIKLWNIPEDQYNLLGIHKLSKNLHDVFNITHFFDLKGEFLSQWTGKSFAACERVGEKKAWWSKFLLNFQLENLGRPGRDSYYTKMLGKYLKEDLQEYKLFNKDQFGSKYIETSKILFLIDRIEKENGYFDFWIRSFDHFKKLPMTLALYQCGQEAREFAEDAKAILGEMILMSLSAPEETFELIKASKIVVTTNRWVARLATYFNKEVFLITDNIRSHAYSQHFSKGVNLLEYRNGAIYMAILEESEEVLDEDIQWEDLFYKIKEQVLDA